jgi:predicted SPOUT superfamily RNA methylase MTH1
VTTLEEGVQTTPAEIPAEGGQAAAPAPEAGIEATTEATEAPAEPAAPAYDEADLLDTSEFGDRLVRLTVDGEEVVVPLQEALKGYNSNAAATKRFQEASRLREEAEQAKTEAADALNLARAVQNNPGLTMQVLAQQAGLTVEQFLNLTPQQQQNVARAPEPEPEFNDPLERALYEERKAREALEQRIEQQEQIFQQQQADAALRSVIGDLQTRYGATDEDVMSVVQQAQQMNAGFEVFPMIFQAQQYQKMQAQTQAQTEAQAAAAAQEAQRQQAAAQASQVVSTGSGAVGTAPQQVVQPMTAEEAIRASLDQFGVT